MVQWCHPVLNFMLGFRQQCPYDGILQIYHNDVYGYICDDGFGSTDAQVSLLSSLCYTRNNPID